MYIYMYVYMYIDIYIYIYIKECILIYTHINIGHLYLTLYVSLIVDEMCVTAGSKSPTNLSTENWRLRVINRPTSSVMEIYNSVIFLVFHLENAAS